MPGHVTLDTDDMWRTAAFEAIGPGGSGDGPRGTRSRLHGECAG